jgi:release factor glutamine methyltransferase
VAVARYNCARHGVLDRVELVEGDLLTAVPPEVRFDAVLSNPPYVSEPEYAALSRDVRDHEPRLALVAGPTGTEVIARLVPAAAERLQPGGWLLCEVSPMIASAVHAIVADDGRFTELRTIPDLAGHARLVQAMRRP